MSIEREILKYLKTQKGKRRLNYKGVRVGFLGLPDFKYYKYQSMVNRLTELNNKGYVKKSKMGDYFIIYKGEEFLNKKEKVLFKRFSTERSDKDPKDLMVIYDITEERKSEREWFRRQLRSFHFIMIQRSVWVGPSPLPASFLEYVKSIKLSDHFKTFKLAKGYS